MFSGRLSASGARLAPNISGAKIREHEVRRNPWYHTFDTNVIISFLKPDSRCLNALAFTLPHSIILTFLHYIVNIIKQYIMILRNLSVSGAHFSAERRKMRMHETRSNLSDEHAVAFCLTPTDAWDIRIRGIV